MTFRIAINGFGRIGRTILRCLLERQETGLSLVAVNDPAPAATLAHLLEFDSLHGRLPHPVALEGGLLHVSAMEIALTAERAPEALDWGGVDLVLECSGQFTAPEQALRHLLGGARRVLLSAPAKGDAKTVVYGVNHDQITAGDRLVSNASCTTNCLAPVAAVLDDRFGIERGMMTTVHSYTSTQSTHDAPHADLYRARAAGLSMIPTTTGAAETLGLVLPGLTGRISGHAIRVPVPNVSCIDLVVDLARPAPAEAINAAFEDATAGRLAGILSTTDRKLVSSDLRRDPHSAVVALDQTHVQGAMARVLAWYDNEWAFAQRMIDTAQAIARL